jgi:predicted DNA-binding transcriptional regulator AlpA
MTAQASQSPHEAANYTIAELRRAVAESAARRVAAAGVDPLLSMREMCLALGMGKTKAHELLKADPQAPKPIRISHRCVRYRASAVRAYIEHLASTAG